MAKSFALRGDAVMRRLSSSVNLCAGLQRITSLPRPSPATPLRGPLGPRIRWQHSQPRSRWQGFKLLTRAHPVAVPSALLVIAFASATLVWSTYMYVNYTAKINERFPEPVANKLRRALYFTSQDVQPQKAADYYKQALELAAELGMDPMSDEIIGVKLTFAAMLENLGAFDRAIETLEIVRRDCQKYVELVGGREGMRGQRTRVLKKVVQLSVKLGELYSNEHLRNTEAAERNLVQAVEVTLGELQRRAKEGIKENEGDWLTEEEIGATLESLGDHYEVKSNFRLAAPLYLRAVTLCPPSCHRAVLMNNLSTSLAQAIPDSSEGPAASREALISNARSWADKALSLASQIKPPERTEECDESCAVAKYNLGQLAEMEGLVEQAKQNYTEAESLSKAIGFSEGVDNARNKLQQLSQR